ncbi:MAG: T9SS type A sorting domain-containing protein [Candidatus Kapaibacterium sp.]
MNKFHRMILLAASGAMLLAPGAFGQVKMTRSVVSNAATRASGGALILNGTLGQALVGSTGSGAMRGLQGYWYGLQVAVPSGVNERERMMFGVVAEASLRCSPNPFSGEAMINAAVPVGGDVSIVLYDALGRRVETLAQGEHEAGMIEIRLMAGGLASGSYLLRMTAAGGIRRTIALAVTR